MYRIKIDIDSAYSLANTLKRYSQNISELRDSISRLSGSLDWESRSRAGVDSMMSSVQNMGSNLSSSLSSLASFVENFTNRISDVDRKSSESIGKISNDYNKALESIRVDALNKNLSMKEKSIIEEKVEILCVFNSDGELLFEKIGDEDSVPKEGESFTKQEISLMQNAIITHNHPNTPDGDSNNSFSNNDLAFAAQCNMKEIRSVSNGYYYSMKPNPVEGWPNSISLKRYWEITLRLILDDMYYRYHPQPIDLQNYDQLFDDVNIEVSKHFGLIYEKGQL